MKRQSITILLAAGGLVTGLATGYLLAGRTTTAQAMNKPAEAPASKEARPRGDANGRSESHDVSRLVRDIRQLEAWGYPTLLREIERMSVAELRAMMEDLISSRPKHFSAESERLNELIDSLSCEWYRREREEALRQIEAMPAGDLRRFMFYALNRAAVREDPAIGRAWGDRYVKEYGDGHGSVMAMLGLDAWVGAVSRNADDLLKAREVFRNYGLSPSASHPYPEDFDFRKVIATGTVGNLNEGLVKAWGARDPDAAWETTKELIEKHGVAAANHVGFIFRGLSTVEDDAVAAKWLAGKIGELTPEDRQKVLLRMSMPEGDDTLKPGRITAVMSALSLPEDRMNFALGLGVLESSPLNALPSPAEREAILLETARLLEPDMKGKEGSADYETMSKFLDKTMKEAGLANDAAGRVRAALFGN